MKNILLLAMASTAILVSTAASEAEGAQWRRSIRGYDRGYNSWRGNYRQNYRPYYRNNNWGYGRWNNYGQRYYNPTYYYPNYYYPYGNGIYYGGNRGGFYFGF